MKLPPNQEKRRLKVLWQYNVLDTPSEAAFDDLTELAAEICGAPIATITFVDENRQWFKSKVGLTATETSRDISFCAQAILSSELLIVPDATKDARFSKNPLVTGAPHIRFYAGAPLVNPDGVILGTICVIDKVPRKLSPSQRHALKVLSRHVVSLLELRRASNDSAYQLRESESQYRVLFDGNPKPMWVLEQETLRFLEVNDAAMQHYGYSRKEFLEMTIFDIRPAEDVPLTAEYCEKVKRGELISRLDKPTLWRHRKKDGTIIDVEITWTTIEFRGAKVYLVLANDTTDRLRSEFKAGTLTRLAQNLSAASTAEEASRIIVKAADELLGWDACSLDLYSPEKNQIEPVLNIDLVDGKKTDVKPAYENSAPSPRIAEVIKNGGTLILRNSSRPVAGGDLRPFGNSGRLSASILFVPIRNVSKVIGVLSIQSYKTNAYDEKALEILQALADQCGGALERISAEEKLAEERNLLRTLLDHLPDYIFVKDLQSRHLLVNKAHVTLRGLTDPNEIIGHTLFERLPKKIADNFLQGDQQVLRTGKPLIDHEEEIVDTAGNLHWLLTTKVPLRDKNNVIVGLVGISRDITERKQIESALRETEEIFQIISENVGDLIAVVDSNGRRLYNSPSYKQIFGSLKILKGADSFAEIHPDDRLRVRAVFDETMRTGIGRRIEYRLLLPDGQVRHIESQGNYVGGPSPELKRATPPCRDLVKN
jgi:PAS domain S-box-containing protein